MSSIQPPEIPQQVEVPASVQQALQRKVADKHKEEKADIITLFKQQIPQYGMQIIGALFMKNPKTTLAGVAGAMPVLITGIIALIGGDPANGIPKVLEAFGIILLGFFANDAIKAVSGGTSEPPVS